MKKGKREYTLIYCLKYKFQKMSSYSFSTRLDENKVESDLVIYFFFGLINDLENNEMKLKGLDKIMLIPVS